jgi:site-specific recombinase XerD
MSDKRSNRKSFLITQNQEVTMDIRLPEDPQFSKYYAKHCKYLKLKGLQPKTIEAYARALRRIGNYFNGQMDNLGQDQLLDYFHELLDSHSWSAVKLDLYGLKFFYTNILKKTWEDIPLIKPPKTTRIPDIVTIEQANQLFAATVKLSYKVFFFTIYSLGLWLGEGIKLKVGDIDADHMRVHIRNAKGNKDRFVPLPENTLHILRNFWRVHKHPLFIFPNRKRGLKNAHLVDSPLDRGGIQTAMKMVTRQWIENQLNKQLPAQYYLITFTLPRQLRKLAWKNQKLIYSLMFQCIQELLKTFTRNDKKLQGMAGFTTVMHTHSRELGFHPHVHVIMVGGSINKNSRLWQVKSGKYLFCHKALAKVFRAKLLKAIVDHNLWVPEDCPKKWVVDCKNVGNGDKALIYLGKYLYKGVIQEKDILKCENGMVTFRYIHSKTGKYRTRTVSGEYFLWLLMQHVLPKGFRRVRCYGFLHPCSKKLIKLLQLILRFNPVMMVKQFKQRAKMTCRFCGARMEIIRTMIPAARIQRATHPT